MMYSLLNSDALLKAKAKSTPDDPLLSLNVSLLKLSSLCDSESHTDRDHKAQPQPSPSNKKL